MDPDNYIYELYFEYSTRETNNIRFDAKEKLKTLIPEVVYPWIENAQFS